MKRLTTFMILVALGLTVDRAFNHGEVTIHLAQTFEEARDWTVRSGGKVAASLTGQA